MRDPKTNIDIIMDYNHYKIHDSQMYNISFSDTIAAAATKEFYMYTGTGEPHIKFDVTTDGQAKIEMYEGITVSANGTSVTVHNMHRDSTDSCAAVVFAAPTWSTNSEILLAVDLIPGSGKNASQIGSTARVDTEWIFKSDEKYLLRITNQAGSTITAYVNCEFYEFDV